MSAAKHKWAVGDRARVVLSEYRGMHYGSVGEEMTVSVVDRLHGQTYLRGVTTIGAKTAWYAARCKPVFRVPARSRRSVTP